MVFSSPSKINDKVSFVYCESLILVPSYKLMSTGTFITMCKKMPHLWLMVTQTINFLKVTLNHWK